MTFIAIALMLVGSAFSATAALGLLRLPDVFTRLHAAAKSGPLGAGLIVLSVGVASGDAFVAIRCVLGLVFLLLVSPISAHLLARAASRAGPSPANIKSIEPLDNSR